MTYAEKNRTDLEQNADSKRADLRAKVSELKSNIRPSAIPGVPDTDEISRAASTAARKGGAVVRENGIGLAAVAAGLAFMAVKATSTPTPRTTANAAAGETTTRAQSDQTSLTNRIRKQPLAAAAVALAGGALIGALLPRTQLEDEYVGPRRDKLRDDAIDKVREGRDQIASAAKEGLDSAKDDLQNK